jgi:hypothetical protein
MCKKNEAKAVLQVMVNLSLDNGIGQQKRQYCPRLKASEIRSFLPPICQLIPAVTLEHCAENWRSQSVGIAKPKRGRPMSAVRAYAGI